MKQSSIWKEPFTLFFWLFNLTLLLVAYVGVLPSMAPAFVADAFAGQLPLDLFLPLIGLVGVPTTSTLVSMAKVPTTSTLVTESPTERQKIRLTHLFYGVEAPLLLVCLIRFFWLRQLTPASTLILITACVCVGAYLHQLLKGNSTARGAWLQLTCHSLMLVIAFYVGTLALFYAIPVLGATLGGLFATPLEAVVLIVTYLVLLVILAIILFPITIVLIGLATVPFGIAILYIQAWRRNLGDFASRYGWTKAWVGTIAVLLTWLTLLTALQQQPQNQAFSLLEKPAQTERDRQILLQQSDKIRQGLLNAYLSPYRYLDYRTENKDIRNLYGSVFHLSEPALQALQNTYNVLISPFLYNGTRLDRDQAAQLYAEFFDIPILRAEQAAIQQAIQSTSNRAQAKAGLLDINQKKVWLREQQVTVEAHGDWADVELYEVYENQTEEQQEIVYSFSLPQSAVITGVWLGETANRAERYPFTVSPRGAAQAVYTQEVTRRVDPALLEQVGPGSYRLRAFPVPAQPSNQLHLWMTYQAMQQKAGWPLPQLSEKRNIFWTPNTKRILNGKAVTRNQDSWFPLVIPATQTAQPTLHQVNLDGYQITAKPLFQSDYRLPQGKRFAVVLDSSRSMSAHTQAAIQTFRWLKQRVVASNDLDLYLTASPGVQPRRIDDLGGFDVAKMTFYGTIQPLQMLRQFELLRGNTAYDAILLITDRGSYELSDDRTAAPVMPAPLWMVHLGGLQLAYNDATFEAIQANGGGVATQVQDALQRFATQSALEPSVVSVGDGYAWFLNKTDDSATLNDDFSPLAARQLVSHLSQEWDLNQLKNLDAIHAIARAFQIVTPYSSMIVLVNERQKFALKQAEKNSDRFKREIEDKQLLQLTNPFAVSAAPEPAEWLLIAIAALALGLIRMRHRQQSVS